MKTRKPRASAISHLFLILVFLFAVGPLLLLVNNALKPKEEFMTKPFGLPSRLTLDNLTASWTQGHYAEAFRNSIGVGIATIVIVCMLGGLAAYSLSKFEFRGRGTVMAFFLFAMSVPLGLFLVPLFFMWQKLHLMDSLVGLIIIYSGIYLPFNVFLLRSYFVGIPHELGEAAKIDGCGELKVFSKIILPIAAPAFSTVALLVGLWTWNEFFFANSFIQSDELRTVSTRYLTFVGSFSSDWSKVSAAGLIAVLPMMALYLFLQRRFIEGMTEGSIKG
ncbi:carbohydrate ABC transporter permease [Cohnella endophytica]|uniref:Carbohydrate ABC transporter permease n=1 Tax=Cohnella endophytica TaxID=2419778 RepID=A0A494XTZ9_9BACL|nr:carbohydrate ABC transporter permease [Cohnella endophytica]RKP51569.1 carbohydrate ABC transporter permease [Cohnella endophytica]